MKISVALAAYNGERYIAQQLSSILDQLDTDDEVIVSLNPSDDNSYNILTTFVIKDNRIKLFECPERGVLPNFENAISKCSGDIIVLADQDDMWTSNKLSVIRELFKDENITCILHNCYYCDKNLNITPKSAFDRKPFTGFWINLMRNSFQGSCMAYRAKLNNVILPLPKKISMQDQWIGLISVLCGNVRIVSEKLIYYRRHEDAVSPPRIPILKKIIYIVCTLYFIILRYNKILNYRR